MEPGRSRDRQTAQRRPALPLRADTEPDSHRGTRAGLVRWTESSPSFCKGDAEDSGCGDTSPACWGVWEQNERSGEGVGFSPFGGGHVPDTSPSNDNPDKRAKGRTPSGSS